MAKKLSPAPLLGDFPKPTPQAWRAAAEETLKGAPFEKKLTTPTYEGITLKPIYTADDLPAGFNGLPGGGALRRAATAQGYLKEGWAVAQELPYGTPSEFAKAAGEDLMRGQNALNVVLDVATQKGLDADEAAIAEVGACGLSLGSTRDMEAAFGKIVWSAIPTYWQAGVAKLPLLALWVAHLKDRKVNLKSVRGSFGDSPLSVWLRYGNLPKEPGKFLDELAAAIKWGRRKMPQMAMINMDSSIVAQAGGNAVQELGYAASTTTLYIQELGKRGIKPREVFSSLRWSFDMGPAFYMEVAKLRAAKVLWSNLVAAYGLPPKDFPPRLGARTGGIDKTIYDAHNNILRNSMEAFAAVLGGVESLTVAPFDECIKSPDAFSRRLARNTQLVLAEEVGLNRIIDPAGGSYAIESLTAELAQKAWGTLQETEKSGGLLKAIISGEFQKSIAATAAERTQRFSQRRDILVGTNLYAVAKETPAEVVSEDFEATRAARSAEMKMVRARQTAKAHKALEKLQKAALDARKEEQLIDDAIAAAAAGATLGQLSAAIGRATQGPAQAIATLKPMRLAAPIEALRATAHHTHAKVFLAAMGTPKEHKVRVDWLRGFCEAGGLEVATSAPLNSPEEAAVAFAQSGAKAAVICGSDDAYPTLVAEIAPALKKASSQAKVYLAGAIPSEQEAAYRAAGLDGGISIKSNHLTTLETLINLYK